MRRKGIPRSAIRKHNRRRPASSIEKLVAAWLTSDGISFKTEVKVGKCHVDIVIDNTVAVELNGCYWHGCPRCYPKMPRKLQLKRFKDMRRYKFLHRRGYDVEILWECDILNRPDVARNTLRRLAQKV